MACLWGQSRYSLPHANAGAFEGGATGTSEDAGEEFNNANVRIEGGTFDIPTDALPSPMFGALPFTQQMLLFEEFGTRPLPLDLSLPAPPSRCRRMPRVLPLVWTSISF